MKIPKRLCNIPQEIQYKIQQRLDDFQKLNKQNNGEWFSELCFCILTANSKAKTAIEIQKQLGSVGFLTKSQDEIAKVIRSVGHRFHNTKAKYIFLARNFKNIKDHLKNLSSHQARDFLVKNIKGLGFKESSHFLRNVGYNDIAIIDRHILRFLHQEKLIDQIPKTITPKVYLECEKILSGFGVDQSRLDLMIWVTMTGEVLK